MRQINVDHLEDNDDNSSQNSFDKYTETPVELEGEGTFVLSQEVAEAQLVENMGPTGCETLLSEREKSMMVLHQQRLEDSMM